MRREAPRTLKTLTSAYQGVSSELYEVIVVENASSEPLGNDAVEAIDPSFRYIYFDSQYPSPAAAINEAVRESRGHAIGILIDGARMLSPGFVKYSLRALRAYHRPLVSTLGCHLGAKPQQESVNEGYNQKVEDTLLESVDWENDGYKLYDISSLAGSSKYGIFAPLAESNAVVLTRQSYDELGGYEEKFISPGGGLVNLDFYQRAQNLPGIQLVTLLGEASFHQFHGGVTTRPVDNWSVMAEEYLLIRGKSFDPYPTPWLNSDYLGNAHESVLPWFKYALDQRNDLLSLMSSNPYKDQSKSDQRNDLDFPQSVVAVLGMHRSGTSLLTGTLQEAGLVLGDVVTQAPHNRKGNREALSIRTLHEDLMKQAGGDWDSPPENINWDPIHVLLRDLIINSFDKETCWGFKDPRSLFCLEGWLDALPELQCVGIFRHPEEVALSLNARNQMSLEEGILLWTLYNKKLLYWHEKLNFPLIYFGEEPDHFRMQAVEVIGELSLPRQLKMEELRFYEPNLRNQTVGTYRLEPEAKNIYDTLLGRSILSQKEIKSELTPPEDSKGWRSQSLSWWRTIRNL